MRVSNIYNDVPISWCRSTFWCTSLFSLRHCSWIYPYRDAGQFSDASLRFFYYVTIHGHTHILMQINFLMQVNGFLFTTSSFMDVPISWCGSIFWCKSTNFLPRHHSRIYPYRDAGQFSDASQLIFYYITIHGYTHIMMRVNFLMQVNGLLFTTSPFMDVHISWCESIFWCKSTNFFITSPFMGIPISWCRSIFSCKSTVSLLRHFGQKPTCYVLISNHRRTVRNCVPMSGVIIDKQF